MKVREEIWESDAKNVCSYIPRTSPERERWEERRVHQAPPPPKTQPPKTVFSSTNIHHAHAHYSCLLFPPAHLPKMHRMKRSVGWRGARTTACHADIFKIVERDTAHVFMQAGTKHHHHQLPHTRRTRGREGGSPQEKVRVQQCQRACEKTESTVHPCSSEPVPGELPFSCEVSLFQARCRPQASCSHYVKMLLLMATHLHENNTCYRKCMYTHSTSRPGEGKEKGSCVCERLQWEEMLCVAQRGREA